MTDDNPTKILALIAGVTSATEISLNKGTDNKVGKGDVVEYSRTENIYDPVTKGKLGSVKYPICNFKIILAADKFSIAQVTDTYAESSAFVLTTTTFTGGKKLKNVSDDESKVRNGVILVKIGDEVTITKPIPVSIPKNSKESK